MQVTIGDAHAYTRKFIKIEDLAYKYNLSLEDTRQQVYDHLKDKARTRRRWTQEEKDDLKNALIGSLELHGGATRVSRQHGLGSLRHALAVIGLKSLDELRYSDNGKLVATLKRCKLRLCRYRLYVPDTRKGIILSDEELQALIGSPEAWLKANIEKVKPLFIKRKRGARKAPKVPAE